MKGPIKWSLIGQTSSAPVRTWVTPVLTEALCLAGKLWDNRTNNSSQGPGTECAGLSIHCPIKSPQDPVGYLLCAYFTDAETEDQRTELPKVTAGPEPQQAASRALNCSVKVPAPQRHHYCSLFQEPLKLRSCCQWCILHYYCYLRKKQRTWQLSRGTGEHWCYLSVPVYREVRKGKLELLEQGAPQSSLYTVF